VVPYLPTIPIPRIFQLHTQVKSSENCEISRSIKFHKIHAELRFNYPCGTSSPSRRRLRLTSSALPPIMALRCDAIPVALSPECVPLNPGKSADMGIQCRFTCHPVHQINFLLCSSASFLPVNFCFSACSVM
jgi:hypothetical protein